MKTISSPPRNAVRSATSLFRNLTLALAVVLGASAQEDKATEGVARLFILSGQSNMVALDPRETFVPALQAAFPKDEIVVIKDAESGQPLSRWFAREKPRDLYNRLWKKVDATTKDRKFESMTFVWMQGEADASWAADSKRYEAHMKGLIQQLRKDLSNDGLTVVVGRIGSHFSGSPDGDKVREVQVGLAAADPLVGWVDTDELERTEDHIHLTQKGREEMGELFAKKAIELISMPIGTDKK